MTASHRRFFAARLAFAFPEAARSLPAVARFPALARASPSTIAALTHVIGGSPSTINCHEPPSFADPYSFPVRVPK
jgi:hypothetical protein